MLFRSNVFVFLENTVYFYFILFSPETGSVLRKIKLVWSNLFKSVATWGHGCVKFDLVRAFIIIHKDQNLEYLKIVPDSKLQRFVQSFKL